FPAISRLLVLCRSHVAPAPALLLISPQTTPLVSRCTKNVRMLARCVLHMRATFLTGPNRLRIAQPYHFPKYRSASFTLSHNQKLRNNCLIAQARAVTQLDSLNDENRWVWWAG